MGEDNPPKTKRSHRTIRLLPDVVAVLRAMPAPLHATDETFLFTTPTGRPIDEERFVEKHWHRAIRATRIRPRKFQATRHTFISVALNKGANFKCVSPVLRHLGRDDRRALREVARRRRGTARHPGTPTDRR
jgi:integrase